MSNTKTITLNQNDYTTLQMLSCSILKMKKISTLNQNEINSILQTNSKIQ